MKIRWDPIKQRFPGFHGNYVVDTWRGQLRIKSWPRKRGRPKSAEVRVQNSWFTSANLLAKHCAASQQVQAIAMTKGTGLYPRDLLLKCMSRGIIEPITPDGRVISYYRPRIDPVAFQGFMLNLDAEVTIALGSFQTFNWPLPIRDTAAFWNVAIPDRVTIPPGVTMMQFFAAALAPLSYTGNAIVAIKGPTGTEYGWSEGEGTNNHGLMTSSGPIPVAEGEVFQAQYFSTANGRLIGDRRTYFGGVVLEAA